MDTMTDQELRSKRALVLRIRDYLLLSAAAGREAEDWCDACKEDIGPIWSFGQLMPNSALDPVADGLRGKRAILQT